MKALSSPLIDDSLQGLETRETKQNAAGLISHSLGFPFLEGVGGWPHVASLLSSTIRFRRDLKKRQTLLFIGLDPSSGCFIVIFLVYKSQMNTGRSWITSLVPPAVLKSAVDFPCVFFFFFSDQVLPDGFVKYIKYRVGFRDRISTLHIKSIAKPGCFKCDFLHIVSWTVAITSYYIRFFLNKCSYLSEFMSNSWVSVVGKRKIPSLLQDDDLIWKSGWEFWLYPEGNRPDLLPVSCWALAMWPCAAAGGLERQLKAADVTGYLQVPPKAAAFLCIMGKVLAVAGRVCCSAMQLPTSVWLK